MNRNYLMTLNNPQMFCQEYLQKIHDTLKAVYTVGQLEKGEQGTAHIQFFMNFNPPIRAARIKKFDNKLHIEAVKVNNGADKYCMKEDTRLEGPFEFGVKPVERNSKKDWEEVFEKAKAGDFEAIPADIKVKHWGNLQKIKKDHMVVADSDHLRGIWIWGQSGIGKSRKAREDYPGHYPKLCNKWWDGY